MRLEKKTAKQPKSPPASGSASPDNDRQTASQGMFRAMLFQVRRIPRGKVATYGDVAYAAGFPGAARQVAWALHSQSHGLPWHRVLGAGGRILLTGEMACEQRLRLEAEKVCFHGLRVDMDSHRHAFFKKKKVPNIRGAQRS